MRAVRFFQKSITAMTLLLVFAALGGAVITVNSTATLLKRNVDGTYASLGTSLAIVAGAVMLITVLRFVYRRIDGLSNKKLTMLSLVLFAVYGLISLFVVMNFQAFPTTDSKIIQGYALAVAKGEISTVSDPYFVRYTNNDLLFLLTTVFFKALNAIGITDLKLWTIVLNAVCIFISELFVYLAVKKHWGKTQACKYMALSVLQPTLYLMIPWVYSATLCLPFITGVFYLGICIYHTKSKCASVLLCIVFALLSAIGYFLRPIVLIAAIAYSICALMYAIIKKGNLKRILSIALCCSLVFSVCFLGIRAVKSHYFERSPDGEYPITHWIMMGLNRHGSWDNNDVKLTGSFKTKDEKLQANLAEIKNRLTGMGVLGFARHICAKQVTTWSDGSAGHNLRLRRNHRYGNIYKYVTDDRSEFLVLYCQIYRAVILILICFSLFQIIMSKKIRFEFMPVLILFGGMLFYLIWEAKHCYSVPFLFLMVLLASLAPYSIRKTKKNYRQKEIRIKFICHGLIAASVIVMFIHGIPKWTQAEHQSIYYSVLDTDLRSQKAYLKFNEIKQTFVTENDFDTIELHANKYRGIGEYMLTLTDKDGTVLVQREFSEQDITDISSKNTGIVKLSFDAVPVNGRTEYSVTISHKGGDNSLKLYRESTIDSDLYEGTFNCDGEKSQNDLVMSVYRITQEPYMPTWCYIAVFLLAIVPYLATLTLEIYSVRRKSYEKSNLSVQ